MPCSPPLCRCIPLSIVAVTPLYGASSTALPSWTLTLLPGCLTMRPSWTPTAGILSSYLGSDSHSGIFLCMGVLPTLLKLWYTHLATIPCAQPSLLHGALNPHTGLPFFMEALLALFEFLHFLRGISGSSQPLHYGLPCSVPPNRLRTELFRRRREGEVRGRNG